MSNLVMGPEQEPVDPDWLIEWSMRYNHAGINARYIYNFRADPEDELCACGDSARWPTQQGHMRYLGLLSKVDVYDEDGALIDSTYVELP